MLNDKIIKAVATAGYIGYLPYAPGTYASLAGLLMYLVLGSYVFVYCALTIAVTLAGFYVAGRAARIFGKNDPPEVVIDEVTGMLIAFLFLPYSINILILGFIIFRALDIFKIPPVNRLQRLPGGYGIMLDDIAAGVITNILLRGAMILFR